MEHLLAQQPGDLADYKFGNLEKKLAQVKAKVKGALEFAVRAYEKDLPLNVKADGGEDCVNAKLLPFLRKIPTLARALFYLSQPAVTATFIKNFLIERERLCAAGPGTKAKDYSAVDIFADRMSRVLSFVERDLSFSDLCIKSDFADELLSTHNQDKSLPNNSRFSYVLRAFYAMLSRLVSLEVQLYVNMTKMFVNTVNDMGLESVMSLQLRIAMVRSASQTAFAEANAVFERQLMRQIPEMLTELMTALLAVPAKEAMEKNLGTTALAIPRAQDPAFSSFMDIDNLVNIALSVELRTAVEPAVHDWWTVAMNKRAYDAVRTAHAVAERKKRKKPAKEEKAEEEPVAEKPKKKKKKKAKKAAAEAEAEAEPAAEPEPEAEGAAEPEKKKKKKKKKKEAVLA